MLLRNVCNVILALHECLIILEIWAVDCILDDVSLRLKTFQDFKVKGTSIVDVLELLVLLFYFPLSS